MAWTNWWSVLFRSTMTEQMGYCVQWMEHNQSSDSSTAQFSAIIKPTFINALIDELEGLSGNSRAKLLIEGQLSK